VSRVSPVMTAPGPAVGRSPYLDYCPPGCDPRHQPARTARASGWDRQLDLNGTAVGTLSQTFVTTPGVTYQLSFAYANNYVHTNQANPARATVLVVGGSGANLIDALEIAHGTSTATDLHWDVANLAFVANGDTATLRFISSSPSTPLGGILLHGNAVVPVPEPSSFLVAAAAAGAALLRSKW
jgi:hypothetical protein